MWVRVQTKERARETLARRYCNAALTQEQLLSALYSFSDNNSYLLFNRWVKHDTVTLAGWGLGPRAAPWPGWNKHPSATTQSTACGNALRVWQGAEGVSTVGDV